LNIQKALPVITSIGIILLVAFLRDRSKTLAAILATMPINIPLGLWVVFGGNESQQAELLFVRALVPGLAATMLWVVAVYVLVRMGFSLWVGIAGGYVVWGLLMFIFIRTGLIVVSR
jgi:hypothetical protein